MLFTPEQITKIQSLLDASQVIEAVKEVKDLLKLGLKDSKDIIDFWREHGHPPESFLPSSGLPRHISDDIQSPYNRE
jgi:hypothetical protein